MKSWAAYFQFSFRKALALALVAAVVTPALALLGLTWETGQLAVAGLTLVVGTIFLCTAWAAASAIVARRFRFSLRTLLILTTLLAMLLASAGRWMLQTRRDAAERAEAIATLQGLGAVIYFDYQREKTPAASNGWTQLGNVLLVPAWVRVPLVDTYLSAVQEVELFNRPLSKGDMIRLRAALEVLPINPNKGVSLTLRNADLEDDELAVLVGMPGLRELDFVDNQLTDASFDLLSEMPELDVVRLGGNSISTAAWEAFYPLLERRALQELQEEGKMQE